MMLPIFSHLHMGEVVQRGPWDWLQSREITKQMDMEQISINLPRERINQVKIAVCVFVCVCVCVCVCVAVVGSWFYCYLFRS